MKQCKSCRTRAETDAEVCPVCGIDQDKARKDLTQKEKQIRRAAHHIRLAAMLHLLGAGICIMALPEVEHRIALAAFAIVNVILAIGLIQYDLRAYRLAVVCYFALGIVNVITVNLLAIPVILILLYVVGNKTAKALFERRAQEI